MNATPEVAAYCLGKLGPGQIQNYSWYVRQSGLTVAILSFLRIGRTEIEGQNYGDLIFNTYPDDLLFRNGVFNPQSRPETAAWPKQVAGLKQDSSVKKIFLSIGGQGYDNVFDFRTIEYMLDNGLEGVLEQNFFMLRQTFLTDAGDYAIDGIDLDCEEDVDPDTIVDFSRMLFQDRLRSDVRSVPVSELVGGLHAAIVVRRPQGELVESPMFRRRQPGPYEHPALAPEPRLRGRRSRRGVLSDARTRRTRRRPGERAVPHRPGRHRGDLFPVEGHGPWTSRRLPLEL